LNRARAASRASSIRTGPILVSSSRPDEATRLISERYDHLPSSAALQETDLSVQPIGLDLPTDPPDSFRRRTLLALDLLRGLLLALHADESIALFLRSDQESDENWYSRQESWSESPLYALRLLANPAAPGFMLLMGVGVVLFQQSRLQLGWTRWQLLRRYAVRGGMMMLFNVLLRIDFTVREDGSSIIENLLLWSFGIDLFLLGCTAIALHTFERHVVNRYLGVVERKDYQEDEPFLAGSQDDEGLKAESIAYHLGNAGLAVLAGLFFMMNMLAVPPYGTQAGQRSDWFWFWIMPMPTDEDRPYSKLMSAYSPLNWLPFGLLGIIYGRFLTRRARTPALLYAINLFIFVILATLFVLTRVLQFGNLSSHLLPHPAHPRHPHNPYYESWQAFLYTVKFPPDVAYSSLSLACVAALFTAIAAVPTVWKERLPILHFGRAPIFFYCANLLVFRFVANFALTFFGLPTRLEFLPALCCYFGTLVIVWFLCKGFLAFKDNTSSPDSFWRFL